MEKVENAEKLTRVPFLYKKKVGSREEKNSPCKNKKDGCCVLLGNIITWLQGLIN